MKCTEIALICPLLIVAEFLPERRAQEVCCDSVYFVASDIITPLHHQDWW